MAIISYADLAKGQDNDITLTVSELLTKVTALGLDTYYRETSNWSKVILTYTTELGQVNDVVFDIVANTLIGNFNPSSTSQDIWNISSLTILDHDNGSVMIEKSNLNEPEFAEIDLAALALIFERDFTDLSGFVQFENFSTDGVVFDTFENNGLNITLDPSFTGSARAGYEYSNLENNLQVGVNYNFVLNFDVVNNDNRDVLIEVYFDQVFENRFYSASAENQSISITSTTYAGGVLNIVVSHDTGEIEPVTFILKNYQINEA